MKSRNNEKGVGGRLQQLWVKTARTVPKRGMPERRCSGTRRQELLINQHIGVGLRRATSARRTPLFMASLSDLSPDTCLFMVRRCINSSLARLNTSRAINSVFAPASLWFQACSCSDHATTTTSRTASTGGRLLAGVTPATMQADASSARAARGLNGSFSFVNNAGTVFQQGSSQRASKPNNSGHTVVVVVQGSCRDKRYDDLT